MVAVIQFAIAFGSTIGGLLLDTRGYKSSLIASAILLLVSALMTFLASRPQTRQGA